MHGMKSCASLRGGRMPARGARSRPAANPSQIRAERLRHTTAGGSSGQTQAAERPGGRAPSSERRADADSGCTLRRYHRHRRSRCEAVSSRTHLFYRLSGITWTAAAPRCAGLRHPRVSPRVTDSCSVSSFPDQCSLRLFRKCDLLAADAAYPPRFTLDQQHLNTNDPTAVQPEATAALPAPARAKAGACPRQAALPIRLPVAVEYVGA